MDRDLRPGEASTPPPGEATRRAAENRRRLAELGPGDDAAELMQEIGEEQGYVELPAGTYQVGEYRLSTRTPDVSGGS